MSVADLLGPCFPCRFGWLKSSLLLFKSPIKSQQIHCVLTKWFRIYPAFSYMFIYMFITSNSWTIPINFLQIVEICWKCSHHSHQTHGELIITWSSSTPWRPVPVLARTPSNSTGSPASCCTPGPRRGTTSPIWHGSVGGGFFQHDVCGWCSGN